MCKPTHSCKRYKFQSRFGDKSVSEIVRWGVIRYGDPDEEKEKEKQKKEKGSPLIRLCCWGAPIHLMEGR